MIPSREVEGSVGGVCVTRPRVSTVPGRARSAPPPAAGAEARATAVGVACGRRGAPSPEASSSGARMVSPARVTPASDDRRPWPTRPTGASSPRPAAAATGGGCTDVSAVKRAAARASGAGDGAPELLAAATSKLAAPVRASPANGGPSAEVEAAASVGGTTRAGVGGTRASSAAAGAGATRAGVGGTGSPPTGASGVNAAAGASGAGVPAATPAGAGGLASGTARAGVLATRAAGTGGALASDVSPTAEDTRSTGSAGTHRMASPEPSANGVPPEALAEITSDMGPFSTAPTSGRVGPAAPRRSGAPGACAVSGRSAVDAGAGVGVRATELGGGAGTPARAGRAPPATSCSRAVVLGAPDAAGAIPGASVRAFSAAGDGVARSVSGTAGVSPAAGPGSSPPASAGGGSPAGSARGSTGPSTIRPRRGGPAVRITRFRERSRSLARTSSGGSVVGKSVAGDEASASIHCIAASLTPSSPGGRARGAGAGGGTEGAIAGPGGTGRRDRRVERARRLGRRRSLTNLASQRPPVCVIPPTAPRPR